jgi:hypothetical protein
VSKFNDSHVVVQYNELAMVPSFYKFPVCNTFESYDESTNACQVCPAGSVTLEFQSRACVSCSAIIYSQLAGTFLKLKAIEICGKSIIYNKPPEVIVPIQNTSDNSSANVTTSNVAVAPQVESIMEIPSTPMKLNTTTSIQKGTMVFEPEHFGDNPDITPAMVIALSILLPAVVVSLVAAAIFFYRERRNRVQSLSKSISVEPTSKGKLDGKTTDGEVNKHYIL